MRNKYKTVGFNSYIHEWPAWLQQNATSTPGLPHHDTQQNRNKNIMRAKGKWRFLHWHLNGTLQILRNLDEGHKKHLHLQHSQLPPQIHHSLEWNTRSQVTTAAKNLATVLSTTKLVQLNKIDKQGLKRLNNIFTTVVNSKNQSQHPSHETNTNVPNTHGRMQPHAKPQDHHLQGCVEMPHIISTPKPPQNGNNIRSQIPMPIMSWTQDTPLLGLVANMQWKTKHVTITQEYMWVAWDDTQWILRQSATTT